MSNNRKMTPRLAAGALTAGLLAINTLQAGAAPITVLNQSFEQRGSGASILGWAGGFSDPAGGDLPIVNPATGISNASLAGNYNTFSTSTSTGYTILNAGDVFTLTVAIGRPSSGNVLTAADYVDLVNFQLNGSTVAQNSILTTGSFVNGGSFYYWVDASVTYTATLADVGKTVGILLGGPAYTDPAQGHRRYFDNVRLDVASAIPEPSGTGLLLGAAAGLFGMKRLRSRRVFGR